MGGEHGGARQKRWRRCRESESRIFLIYDLLKGLVALWIYAALRPSSGPGPKTALIAAILVWLLVIPVPIIGLLPMKFSAPS